MFLDDEYNTRFLCREGANVSGPAPAAPRRTDHVAGGRHLQNTTTEGRLVLDVVGSRGRRGRRRAVLRFQTPQVDELMEFGGSAVRPPPLPSAARCKGGLLHSGMPGSALPDEVVDHGQREDVRLGVRRPLLRSSSIDGGPSGAMKRTVPQFDVRSSPLTLSSASAWAWSSMLPRLETPCILLSSIVASDCRDRVRSTPLPLRVLAIPKSPSFTRSDAVRRKFAVLCPCVERRREIAAGVDSRAAAATASRRRGIDANFEVQKQTLSQHLWIDRRLPAMQVLYR